MPKKKKDKMMGSDAPRNRKRVTTIHILHSPGKGRKQHILDAVRKSGIATGQRISSAASPPASWMKETKEPGVRDNPSGPKRRKTGKKVRRSKMGVPRRRRV